MDPRAARLITDLALARARGRRARLAGGPVHRGVTLVGCTVGPGFEFDDFTMLAERAEDAARARRDHPDTAPFI